MNSLIRNDTRRFCRATVFLRLQRIYFMLFNSEYWKASSTGMKTEKFGDPGSDMIPLSRSIYQLFRKHQEIQPNCIISNDICDQIWKHVLISIDFSKNAC